MLQTPPKTSSLISLKSTNLKTSYDNSFTLDIPSLEISGRVLSVIGHNGSGKSTLIKTALGLLVPDSGNLEISKTNQWGDHTRLVPEKHMAYSPENGSVFADITVENYIKLWCRIKQSNANFYKLAGRKYIDTLGVAPLLGKLGRNLSKGERRRVQTAAGFICEPQLFFFDEPFDGLDVRQSSQLAEIMKEASLSMGLIVSSHQMNVVERLADKVIVLKEGRVHSFGSVVEVSKGLAEKTLAIHLPSEELAINLSMGIREGFKDCLVHQHSNRVFFTGNSVSKNTLIGFCKELGLNSFELEETSPTLTDAMGYHLMKLDLAA